MQKLFRAIAIACVAACGSVAKAPPKTAPSPAAPKAVLAFSEADQPVRLRISNLGFSLVLPSVRWRHSLETMPDGVTFLKVDLTDTSISLQIYAYANQRGLPLDQLVEAERQVFLQNVDSKTAVSKLLDDGAGRWAFEVEGVIASSDALTHAKIYAAPIPGRTDMYLVIAAIGLVADYHRAEGAVSGIVRSIELSQ